MHDCNNTTSVLSLLAAMLIALLLSPEVHAGETRIIKDKGIEIEAFVFGEGSQTLIIAAGNGRPVADLEELAKGIAAGGIRAVTYNYRTIGASKAWFPYFRLYSPKQAFMDRSWVLPCRKEEMI